MSIQRDNYGRLMFGLFSIFLISSLSCADPATNGNFYQRFTTPSMEYITPHIAWLKPSINGKLKVHFVTYRAGMREVVEFAERMDLDYRVFGMANPDEIISMNEYDYAPPPRPTPEGVSGDLLNMLAEPCDLLVIGAINFGKLPIKVRYQILKKVSEGMPMLGFVLGRDEYLERAVKEKAKTEVSFLFPFKGLPAFSKYADFNALITNTVETVRFGKGKMALLKGYKIPGGYQMLTPKMEGDPFTAKQLDYDYYMAYAIHLMLYALGREPAITIKGADYQVFDRNHPQPVRFVVGSGENKKMAGEFVLRDRDNNVVTSENRSLSLAAGDNAVNFDVRRLPAGGYYADLWVKEQGKTVDFGSVFVEVSSPMTVAGIDIKPSLSKEEAVEGKIVISGMESGKKLSVRVSRKDNYGRITDRQTLPAGDMKAVAFHFKAGRPFTVLQYVEAELLDGNDVVDTKQAVFSISNLYPRDDVRYIIWDAGVETSYLTRYLLDELKHNGFDGTIGGFYRQLPLANMSHIPLLNVDGQRPNKKTRDHVRVPCVLNSDFLKQESELVNRRAETVRPFSVNEFSLGDEVTFGNVGETLLELCFCTNCVAAFHGFLKKEYQTLENMNREYQTQYTSFDEVKPVTVAEAKKDSRLVPLWVDYRRHMDEAWIGWFRFCAEAIQKIIPGAKAGATGASFVAINSFGYNSADYFHYFKTVRNAGAACGSGGGGLEFLSDLCQPGTLKGISFRPHGCWDGTRNALPGTCAPALPWDWLFQGANSFWSFIARPGGYVFSVVAPDFTFHDFARPHNEAVREIKKGVGKLLMQTRKDNDGIAVLYSVSSVHVATLTDGLPRSDVCWYDNAMDRALTSNLLRLLWDSGHQWQVIAYGQLPEGILGKENIKYLFLPITQALSREEAAAVESFVKNGGTVIADARPGVCDEHGKPYAKGILDEVFGVRQNTKAPKMERRAITMKDPPFSQTLSNCVSDATLETAGGTALASAGSGPALIVNNYGKGKAILLNFCLSEYYAGPSCGYGRTTPDTPYVMAFFKTLCSLAGIEAPFKITTDIAEIRAFRFSAGPMQYLGLTTIFYNDAGKDFFHPKAPPAPVVVTMPRAYHVYNMRAGKYLGLTDRIETRAELREGYLYSLLPYQVKGVKIEMPSKIQQGENLDYSIRIEADATTGLHVFHVALIAPDGKEAECYTDNLRAEQGAVGGSIPLALNERPGTWKCVVKDAATGIEAEKQFKVKEK